MRRQIEALLRQIDQLWEEIEGVELPGGSDEQWDVEQRLAEIDDEFRLLPEGSAEQWQVECRLLMLRSKARRCMGVNATPFTFKFDDDEEEEPQRVSSLAREMASTDMPEEIYMWRRFPRLTRAMAWPAILRGTEAGEALRGYVLQRDANGLSSGSGAIPFGEPAAILAAGIRSRAGGGISR